MTENQLSYTIRGIAFNIYNTLGPGLLESVYEEVFCYELKRGKLYFDRQKSLPVYWDNLKLDHGFRANIIVENKLILEIKSVEVTNDLFKNYRY